MSLVRVVCFIVTCRDCGIQFKHGDEYTPHFPSSQEATEYLEDATMRGDSDWTVLGAHILCGTCKDKPHSFVAKNGEPESCWRCWEAEEDHPPHKAEVVKILSQYRPQEYRAKCDCNWRGTKVRQPKTAQRHVDQHIASVSGVSAKSGEGGRG